VLRSRADHLHLRLQKLRRTFDGLLDPPRNRVPFRQGDLQRATIEVPAKRLVTGHVGLHGCRQADGSEDAGLLRRVELGPVLVARQRGERLVVRGM
jgi:hypothetical protein